MVYSNKHIFVIKIFFALDVHSYNICYKNRQNLESSFGWCVIPQPPSYYGLFLVLIEKKEKLDSGSMCSPVALQFRPPPPKVSARAPAHRSYHFRGVKLKSCIKKIHHNLYISKQANARIKHADTEGASHKKFGTDARVQ